MVPCESGYVFDGCNWGFRLSVFSQPDRPVVRIPPPTLPSYPAGARIPNRLLRGDFRPESDVDVLVTFAQKARSRTGPIPRPSIFGRRQQSDPSTHQYESF